MVLPNNYIYTTTTPGVMTATVDVPIGEYIRSVSPHRLKAMGRLHYNQADLNPATQRSLVSSLTEVPPPHRNRDSSTMTGQNGTGEGNEKEENAGERVSNWVGRGNGDGGGGGGNGGGGGGGAGDVVMMTDVSDKGQGTSHRPSDASEW